MNFDSIRQDFEQFFRSFIQEFYGEGKKLHEMIAYILAGEGKRVRAMLALYSAKAAGGRIEDAYLAAVSLEMVHAYSLVHDDLPCMDNDSLRRGRPTAHVVYDDASALLAGDAIVTDCLGILAAPKISSILAPFAPGHEIRLDLIKELTSATGSRGIVHGQMLDMHWTNRADATLADLDEVHLLKTGALIGAACSMGAVSSGKASARDVQSFRQFGFIIGHVFQIIDDLLDESKDSGKSRGKDKASAKLCYLKLMNADEARKKAEDLTQTAVKLMQGRGENAADLLAYVKILLHRAK